MWFDTLRRYHRSETCEHVRAVQVPDRQVPVRPKLPLRVRHAPDCSWVPQKGPQHASFLLLTAAGQPIELSGVVNSVCCCSVAKMLEKSGRAVRGGEMWSSGMEKWIALPFLGSSSWSSAETSIGRLSAPPCTVMMGGAAGIPSRISKIHMQDIKAVVKCETS